MGRQSLMRTLAIGSFSIRLRSDCLHDRRGHSTRHDERELQASVDQNTNKRPKLITNISPSFFCIDILRSHMIKTGIKT